jgi:NADH-quinone oxidoreductase subunit G
VVRAAASVVHALRDKGRPARLCLTVPECNSLGLALLGGEPLAEAFRKVREGEADILIILENDLYRRAETETVDALLQAARHVIVLDHLETPTTSRADLALPAATFAESSGTIVNNEGRAQRFVEVFVPRGEVQASWRWLKDLAVAAGGRACSGWESLDDVVAALASALPVFSPLPAIAPPANYRAKGMRIPRQPHRYSGRTAMLASVTVHEPKPPEDPDSALSFSMEGFEGQPPPALTAHLWAPGWNSIQALNKFQAEVGGPLRGGDPGRRLLEGEQPTGRPEPSPGTPGPSGETPQPCGPGLSQEVSGPFAGARQSAQAEPPGEAPAPTDGPPPHGKPRSREDASAPFRVSEGEWLLVPVHRIFGSEELSALSPGIAELAGEPCVVVHPEDAEKIGARGVQVTAQGGEQVSLEARGRAVRMQLKLSNAVPRGVAGVSVGLPGQPFLDLPATGRIISGSGS